MNIITLPLGSYQTNCYLLSDDAGSTVIIDPGFTPELVAQRLEAEALKPAAIALTHAHFDHVGGVRALAALFRCPVYVHKAELSLPEQMTGGTLFYTDFYADALTAGALTLTVLHTPGHTPGSVCLQSGDVLFTGDTLFAGSCGRVDFPGGDMQQMYASLRLLAELPGDYRILPGHEAETTLNRERSTNPYMREALHR